MTSYSVFLRESLGALLENPPELNLAGHDLSIILIVGVNGSGKTTSIAKLANLLHKQGRKVMLAAGDTFRAAAIEQLSTWGERIGVPVIRNQTGADPGAVVL
jgi:fused signal recognition particle receptor